MTNDKWVMVRNGDREEWHPHILLRDLGAGYPYRHICLSRSGTCAVSFTDMRPAKAVELLPCLPGEWAARAILRTKERPHVPDVEVGTLADAVDYAILWGDTPEWHHVWRSLHIALRDGTEIPECPPLAAPEPEPEPAPEPCTVRCACGRVVRVSYEFFEEGN